MEVPHSLNNYSFQCNLTKPLTPSVELNIHIHYSKEQRKAGAEAGRGGEIQMDGGDEVTEKTESGARERKKSK